MELASLILTYSATASIIIASTLTGVLFWVMAPAALALSQIALCKAITGLFAEPHEYHESNTITYTMRTSEPARSHTCVAVSGVRCPTA